MKDIPSVIVYRNPFEAAMWDMLMNNPYLFPFMVAVFGAILAGVGASHVLDIVIYRRLRSRNINGPLRNFLFAYQGVFVGSISALVFVSIFFYMV